MATTGHKLDRLINRPLPLLKKPGEVVISACSCVLTRGRCCRSEVAFKLGARKVPALCTECRFTSCKYGQSCGAR